MFLALLLLVACAAPGPAAAPLSAGERRDVVRYLESVASLNREARDRRTRTRLFLPDVPAMAWEGRAGRSVGFGLNEVRDFAFNFKKFGQKAREIDVPPPAAPAHQAYVRSIDATEEMLAVHERILEEFIDAYDRENPLPPRAEGEAAMKAARQRADLATEEAERAMSDLVRRVEVTPAT